jgi:hypothetical protein
VAAPIQVLVADMPPLLRDIVESAVMRQRDMKLVNPERARRERSSGDARPVVIVLGGEEADDGRAAAWLDRWPHARVIFVETSGRESVLYELRPHATVMGELAPEQLIDAIRRAAGVAAAFANRQARSS